MKKEEARAQLSELVRKFRRNEADYLRSTYGETQARTEFITPLLEVFGWDVRNTKSQALALREVIEEATVEVGEERLSKKPDYELRLARQRKFFVEAKKPSVHIDRDNAPAFQVRRYGYSASLPISVLTNFQHLIIYDCLPPPSDADDVRITRLAIIRYDEFEARFDDLWGMISRDAVYSGDFDRRYSVSATRHGTDQFDKYFLEQVQDWRKRLATDIHLNTPHLNPEQLTYVVQLFISRIVFLRICEDRDIEKYETLKTLDTANTFAALMELLRRADAFYDSGLFRLLNDERLGVRIGDATLKEIIAELYYPKSPYTFAVVETEVLGEIYEQFLGEVIVVSGRKIKIVSKPEVRESGGVVPTPRYIVDTIVERSLTPQIAGKSPEGLAGFTIADICCGSGVFLLSAYESLLDHHLSWYLKNNRARHVGQTIYEVAAGQWRLTFEEKRRILSESIRGVDIDANAVEVARFSLLLKLIENETATGLQSYVKNHHAPALPSLDLTIRSGNSLVSEAEWVVSQGPIPGAVRDKVNPFTWASEFPTEMGRNGFDVIVGNPPYIRIQNMTAYSPEEIAFYQDPASPYSTARENNFDKYALFIERALTLLRPEGRLGVIIPNKFMTIQAGRALRRLITVEGILEEVVHFGTNQVFGPGTANYTCILILDRNGKNSIRIEKVRSLEGWRYGQLGTVSNVPAAELTENPWDFSDAGTHALFKRVRAAFPNRLDDVAEIFVGVQTSADPIYIIHAASVTAKTITARWNNRDWPIERGILRPCLHDAAIPPYARPQANAWMIFPYELVVKGARTKAQLIQPKDFERRFPRCFNYLSARRQELKLRNVTGGPITAGRWYQFGRSQSLTKFDSPKIILPILSIEPRYCYDDTNVMVTGGGNGPYYMIRPKPGADVTNHYLLAVLNHPMSEAFIRTNTSTFRGGYYSHGKQFIENLPVPILPVPRRKAVERLVASLIDTLDSSSAVETPHQRAIRDRQTVALKSQIENIISEAFRLTPTDLDVVRSVPIPN